MAPPVSGAIGSAAPDPENWIANNQLFLLNSNAQCRVFAESVKVVWSIW